MRSTAALHDEAKPSSMNAAQNSHIARSSALAEIGLPDTARLAPADVTQRHALDRGFARRGKAEQHERRPEQPHREIERARREHDGGAAEQFYDGAGFGALGGGEPGEARHILWAFGNFEAVQRRLRTGLGLDAPDIADKLDKTAGLFDLDRFARDAHRQNRVETAGPARRLDQRQADS